MSVAAAGSRHGLFNVMAMIISGTLNTVFSKMQYGVRARGTSLCADPVDATHMTDVCAFDKPWFSALLAKIGMSLSFVYVLTRHCQSQHRRRRFDTTKKQDTENSTLLLPAATTEQDEYDLSKLPLKTAAAIAWPSLLDLLQTLISNVGLLWVSSSVYQMARGSVIIFSALVSVQFLQKRLYGYHYTSIAIVTLAVALVGWAGMPHDTDSAVRGSVVSSNALLGLALIIVAQFITAVQIVAEEYIMKDLRVQPLVLVGVEGLWGLLFYVVLVPVLTLTPSSTNDAAIAKIWHEDFYDSVVKISHSNALIVLSLLNIIAVAALGPSANYVTKHLSGVMRSIAEVLRTLGVWVVGLFVFYVANWRGSNSPGEAWSIYSWVELVGFVLMVYGTLAYKRIIAMPFPVLYAGTSDEVAETSAVEMSNHKPAFA